MLLEKLNGTKPVLADSTTIADLTADENVTNSGNRMDRTVKRGIFLLVKFRRAHFDLDAKL